MKIKEHLLDVTYAIQDVWEEAENMTSADETIKREMEKNVKFLLFQQGKASFAFKKLFEQVYKEEGITL